MTSTVHLFLALLLLLAPIKAISQQLLGVEDFSKLLNDYNNGAASLPRGWDEEFIFSDSIGLSCQVAMLGKTGALCRGRLAAVRLEEGNFSLQYYMYDERLAVAFEQSLTDEGYTMVEAAENLFSEERTYRRSPYDRCIRFVRIQNTARYNEPERLWIATMGDFRCGATQGFQYCASIDHNGFSHTYSTEGDKIQGPYRIFDTLGHLVFSATYENGQAEGEAYHYTPTGETYITERYVNDLLHGERQVLSPNGSVLSRELWTMGWNTLHEEGKTISRFTYHNRAKQWKDSVVRIYDSHDRLLEEHLTTTTPSQVRLSHKVYKTYKDTSLIVFAEYSTIQQPTSAYSEKYAWMRVLGITEGALYDTVRALLRNDLRNTNDSLFRDSLANGWTIDYSYDSNGQPTQRIIRSYILGHLEAMRVFAGTGEKMPLHHSAAFRGNLCVIRDSKGKITAKGSVAGDKKHGKWQYFSDPKNKKPYIQCFYHYGELDSLYTQTLSFDSATDSWTPIKLQCHYSLGTLHGEYLLADQNKRVISQGNYLFGKKEGLWKEADSSYTWTANYKNGLRDGIQSLYTTSDILFRQATFSNDILLSVSEFDTTTNGVISQYKIQRTNQGTFLQHGTVTNDTIRLLTYRIPQHLVIATANPHTLDSIISHTYTDGAVLVGSASDSTKVYITGTLLRDRHIGTWTYTDYDQEVILQVDYDRNHPDIIRREFYRDLNRQPYSGPYTFHGDLLYNTKFTPEFRQIDNGERIGGFGKATH